LYCFVFIENKVVLGTFWGYLLYVAPALTKYIYVFHATHTMNNYYFALQQMGGVDLADRSYFLVACQTKFIRLEENLSELAKILEPPFKKSWCLSFSFV